MIDEIREECGVMGLYSPTRCDVASQIYYGLYALQHRGQESAGIVVNDDGVFTCCKDSGLVNEVFTKHPLAGLGEGNMAVGHCRYGRGGENNAVNAQPLVVNHVKGHMALCFNGCLINAGELREQLELDGSLFQTSSDAEVIANIIIRKRLTAASIEESISLAMEVLEGAYSMVVMSPRKLIAVRDANGIRPLCFGQCADGTYVVASESCALDAVDAKLIREVEPGEVVVFEDGNVRSLDAHMKNAKHALCLFEYVYTARPDSVIEGVSVNRARYNAGAFLALEHPANADVVVGVPDSGLDAALGFARQSGIPYSMGFLKNKYIGRTFIAPNQKHRDDLVRIKLNVIAEVVRGKRVVLVDDSIVRGTTCRRIIGLLREAGATEVHMRLASPPFIDLCYYGTDIDSRDKLIACQHSLDEIAEIIGVDSLGYLSVENAMKIAPTPSGGFCTGCFTGKYPTRVPDKIVKSRYDQKISDTAFSRVENETKGLDS